MATTYTNEAYPHTAVITRTTLGDPPLYVQTVTPVWEGACDCQVGTGGTTERRDTVFVSDYTIYTACIDVQLQTGDLISVTQKEGWTPLKCTVEQSATENIWVEDGISYGTTIWANSVKS